MPTALLLPVLLRLAGPISFTVAASAAGVLNRSIMLIPLLAVAASLTTILIRTLVPSPINDLHAMLSPNAPPQPQSPFRGIGKRLGFGLVGYGIAFVLAALIAAIFQSTDFEPRLMPSDVGFLIIPAAIAIIGAWLSSRLGFNQMAGMMGQMQDMFAQMKEAERQASGDEPFTVDGEIIHPDDDRRQDS